MCVLRTFDFAYWTLWYQPARVVFPRSALMLLSVGVQAIFAFGLIAVLSISASAKTSVYTIPGEASAVLTTSADFVTFQLTDLFLNPMALMDDLSTFFAAFGTTPDSAQSRPVRRPLLQIRMEGVLRQEAGSLPRAYCRFFPPRPIGEMSVGLHAATGRPLFDARYDDVNAKPSPFKGDAHVPLLDPTATWTVAEMGGASFHRIGLIRFEFGTTDGRDQAAAPFPGGSEPSVRVTLGIAIVIVLLGFMIRRKRQRLAAPVIVRSPAY